MMGKQIMGFLNFSTPWIEWSTLVCGANALFSDPPRPFMGRRQTLSESVWRRGQSDTWSKRTRKVPGFAKCEMRRCQTCGPPPKRRYRRSATARAAKRRQLHQPNLGSEGRPTPRWQPLHASYAAGAADARSRAPRTLFLAAAAANCRIIQCPAQLQNYPIHLLVDRILRSISRDVVRTHAQLIV